MKKFWIGFSLLLFLYAAVPVSAGYCYTPSYSYGYSYPSYSYSYPSYPTYTYTPYYVSYPVTQYVGIPIAVNGSTYNGPAAPATTTTTTRTTTATATVESGAAATAGVATAGGAAGASLAEVLTVVKSSAVILGRVSQRQEATESAVLALRKDHEELRQRMAMVESKVGAPPVIAPLTSKEEKRPVPLAPVDPPGAGAAPSEASAGALTFYKTTCFACHQEGSSTLARNKKTKEAVVLFDKMGKRLPQTADIILALVDHMTSDPPTMPPVSVQLAAGEAAKPGKYPCPTNEQVTVVLLDSRTWPKKKK